MYRLGRGQVEVGPLQSLADRFPDLTPEDVNREITLVDWDGTVRGGVDALVRLAELGTPWLGWPLRRFYKLPLLRQLADQTYAWVAQNRYRWFGRNEECEDGSCGMHYRGPNVDR
jgi:predicted DCC family thiol-disulfide oxidoreductase YuxK